MRKWAVRLAVLLIVLFPSAEAPASESATEFRCRYETGESQDYVLRWTTTSQVTTKGSAPGNSRRSLTVRWRQAVRSVTDQGVATLVRSYRSIRLEIRSPLMEATIDTAKEEKRGAGKHVLLHRILSAAIGRRVTVEVDGRGRILTAKGTEEILTHLRTKFAEEPWAELYLGIATSCLSPEPTSHALHGHLSVLPEGAMSRRESRKSSSVIGFAVAGPARSVDLEVRSTSTLRSGGRVLGVKCARFGIEGGIHARTPLESSRVISGRRYVTRVKKSRIKGELCLDAEACTPVRQEVDLEYTLLHHAVDPEAALTEAAVDKAPVHATEVVTQEIRIDRAPPE